MKKNKIYVGKINKIIRNNQKECEVDKKEYQNKIDENKKIDSQLSLDEKINQLLNNNGYIFSTEVKIITKEKEYQTFIAAVINNRIITIDNIIIDLKDVKDLIIM